MEALNHSVGGVLLLKQFEDRSNSALYLLVWVENDLVAVEYQTNRERKTQLPLLRLVEFTAVEARANDMQFGLSERPLHAKDEAVVEIGRVVATVAIEHQGLGNGAKFQQAMPILVGARQARCLEREDRADVPHSHVAHKGLEVVAFGRQLSRLAEIPVEDSDLLRSPTQRLCLVR